MSTPTFLKPAKPPTLIEQLMQKVFGDEAMSRQAIRRVEDAEQFQKQLGEFGQAPNIFDAPIPGANPEVPDLGTGMAGVIMAGGGQALPPGIRPPVPQVRPGSRIKSKFNLTGINERRPSRELKSSLLDKSVDPKKPGFSSGNEAIAALLEGDLYGIAVNLNLNTVKVPAVKRAQKKIAAITQESLDRKFPDTDTVTLFRGGKPREEGFVPTTTDKGVARRAAERGDGIVRTYRILKSKIAADMQALNRQSDFLESEFLVRFSDLPTPIAHE